MTLEEIRLKEENNFSDKKDEDIISLSNQTNFKRSPSSPINTKNLPLKKEFEILDNSIVESKDIKSINNNDFIIKRLLGNKRRSESIDSNDKIEEIKEPELSLFDKIKFFDTAYDKLACISREIGLQIMIDYIINIINNNSSNSINVSCCDNKDVENLIKEILNEIPEETLYIYLMKILSMEQIQNIEVVTEYKLSLDSKLRSRASIQMVEVRSRFPKKKLFDLEMIQNTNYRSNHFYKLNGEIYCYTPRHFIRSHMCFLYCDNENCKAKLYLDMKRKKGRIHGSHKHKGIDIEKYENEFPEIKEDDWEHIQYDIKDDKKFIVWKT